MSIVKKVIKVFLNTLMTLIIIVGLIFVFLFCIGIEPFVVLSGSMEPTIETGSLSFINKNIKYEEIQEQDIIAFHPEDKIRVMHRAISKTDEGFITKGDANESTDGVIITPEKYIGKQIFSIPKAGYFIRLIQSKRGKIILITIIVVILLAGILIGEPSGKKSKKNKKVDVEEIDNKTISKENVDKGNIKKAKSKQKIEKTLESKKSDSIKTSTVKTNSTKKKSTSSKAVNKKEGNVDNSIKLQANIEKLASLRESINRINIEQQNDAKKSKSTTTKKKNKKESSNDKK